MDIMLDVETLGTNGSFAVTQVAFVPFDLETGEIFDVDNSYKYGISLSSNIKHGMNVNSDTLKWWIDVDAEMLKRQLSHNGTIEECASSMTDFINKVKPDKFWATATLDYQAISLICDAAGMDNPVPFNKRLCARTVRNLWREKTGGVYVNANTHDAYDDCILQIWDLDKHIKELNIY